MASSQYYETLRKLTDVAETLEELRTNVRGLHRQAKLELDAAVARRDIHGQRVPLWADLELKLHGLAVQLERLARAEGGLDEALAAATRAAAEME